ncbi:MAG TPA: glucose-6-phosphate isomerase [Gemmatimonadaceae bacterium]|nr:glucose-6-phosphate isomerase [Gemmatimonadaceae bacterium]
MAIHIDYSNMMAGIVPGGIDEAAWHAARQTFAAAYQTAQQRRRAGELGFIDLVAGQPQLQELRDFADGIGQAFSDVVVLGIGGSALGTIALRSALRPPSWNELSDEARDFFPRLHVLDNADPVTMGALLDRLELGRALFVVVSKSGGTAETMAQYLIVRGRLQDALGEAFGRHLVFITDPEHGALRAIANSEEILSLELPPNVGGRFSVLSAVGLLPAALIGIDVSGLIAGAAEMATRCEAEALDQNPAGVFAVLQWMADTQHGCTNQVLMPYGDALRDMAGWFVQLWAESLGKHGDDGTSRGPTPIAARGSTDQHSQVQLFMEGPRNKTVTFVAVEERTTDLEIPHAHQDLPALAYLGGHTLGELLAAECRATAGALATAGRPNMRLSLERGDAWHIGGLIMLLEMATIYAGALYGVNPLNQPGVELGKRLTYAMLGRPDVPEAQRELASLPAPDPQWTV